MPRGRSNATGRNLGGRKPVSVVAAAGHLTVWARIWAAIRARRKFTSADIVFDTTMREATVQSYVKRLAAHGYVQALEHRPRSSAGKTFRWTPYRLVRDVGIEAPRLKPDGGFSAAGRSIEQLWRAVRILRECNALELHAAASTPEHPIRLGYARQYLLALARAGYVVCSQRAKTGPGATLSRYRFIPAMNTGPLAPMVQRSRAVFDPNRGRVVWPREKEAA